MEISDRLLCLFSATVEEVDGSYVFEVPEQELRLGELDEGAMYQVATLAAPSQATAEAEGGTTNDGDAGRRRGHQAPPVTEGETRRVEIEDIGEQGDGITRVERGFVVIVPDTEKGERVRIEVTDVRENVAFGEVVERLSYYE